VCYEYFSRQATIDFLLRSRLKVQFQGFAKVIARLLDGVALAGDVQLRTKGDETISFTLNEGG